MQHHNELKPEQPSQLIPEQSEHNRRYAPIERALQTEAHGYKWQRETDGIHSYHILKLTAGYNIDTEGQFFVPPHAAHHARKCAWASRPLAQA